jgi:hypothetical protein
MSAFNTKFDSGSVLPKELPKFGSYNPALYGSSAVGGKKSRKHKIKSKRSIKINKSRRMRNRHNKSYRNRI